MLTILSGALQRKLAVARILPPAFLGGLIGALSVARPTGQKI
ncbi:hypothetical protein [Gordonia sp. CPCC 205333]